VEIIRRGITENELPLKLALFSDFHIGSSDVDYKKLKGELQEAADDGRRILINGDVFDLILPKDQKRYQPDAVHPRIRGRRDAVNAAVDWAYELLLPYAGQIDMIGEGNHETAAEKHGGVNAVKLLVQRLGGRVQYAGYTGFVDYRVRGQRGYRYVIFYHHGAGHGAGETQFRKLLQFTEADLVWVGHRHDRITGGSKRLYCPLGGNKVVEKTIRFAMSGSYLRTYRPSALSYGAERMLPPQDQGYVKVDVTLKNHKLIAELRA
jgi:hypothetical protein